MNEEFVGICSHSGETDVLTELRKSLYRVPSGAGNISSHTFGVVAVGNTANLLVVFWTPISACDHQRFAHSIPLTAEA